MHLNINYNVCLWLHNRPLTIMVWVYWIRNFPNGKLCSVFCTHCCILCVWNLTLREHVNYVARYETVLEHVVSYYVVCNYAGRFCFGRSTIWRTKQRTSESQTPEFICRDDRRTPSFQLNTDRGLLPQLGGYCDEETQAGSLSPILVMFLFCGGGIVSGHYRGSESCPYVYASLPNGANLINILESLTCARVRRTIRQCTDDFWGRFTLQWYGIICVVIVTRTQFLQFCDWRHHFSVNQSQGVRIAPAFCDFQVRENGPHLSLRNVTMSYSVWTNVWGAHSVSSPFLSEFAQVNSDRRFLFAEMWEETVAQA
jgi:hypothetical protein